MKAAIYNGPGKLHTIETIEVPKPGPRQVLIEVERCGICGSDLTMGKVPNGPNALAEAFSAIYVPGAVLGHEIGGRVVEVGRDVKRLKVSDRIAPMAMSGCSHCAACQAGTPLWCHGASMPFGGYAQYALADQYFSSLLPPELSVESGALVEPMATSRHAVALAQIPPNARVVVLGSGVIGLGITYFARQAGAGMIAAVARSPRREALAKAMGADFYLPQGPDIAEALADRMGGPADIVFEAAGAPGLVGQGIGLLRPRGKIVVAGIATQAEPNFHVAGVLREVQIIYSTAYTLDEFDLVVRSLRDPASPLQSLISETVSLNGFPERFASLCESGGHNKVLVDPGVGIT